MKLPVPNHVWIIIKEKFGKNLRYVVPGTGNEIRYGVVTILNHTGQPGYTKWEISKNINFAPSFLIYDSSDDTYEFENKKYSEKEFISLMNNFYDGEKYLEDKFVNSMNEIMNRLKEKQ